MKARAVDYLMYAFWILRLSKFLQCRLPRPRLILSTLYNQMLPATTTTFTDNMGAHHSVMFRIC